MNFLTKAYWWFWYHVESFWIKSKRARRPFTYMMRDFVTDHKIIGISIIILELVGLAFLVRWNWIVGYFCLAIYFMVAGHLWWGTPIKKGEQEEPQYIEDTK